MNCWESQWYCWNQDKLSQPQQRCPGAPHVNRSSFSWNIGSRSSGISPSRVRAPESAAPTLQEDTRNTCVFAQWETNRSSLPLPVMWRNAKPTFLLFLSLQRVSSSPVSRRMLLPSGEPNPGSVRFTDMFQFSAIDPKQYFSWVDCTVRIEISQTLQTHRKKNSLWWNSQTPRTGAVQTQVQHEIAQCSSRLQVAAHVWSFQTCETWSWETQAPGHFKLSLKSCDMVTGHFKLTLIKALKQPSTQQGSGSSVFQPCVLMRASNGQRIVAVSHGALVLVFWVVCSALEVPHQLESNWKAAALVFWGYDADRLVQDMPPEVPKFVWQQKKVRSSVVQKCGRTWQSSAGPGRGGEVVRRKERNFQFSFFFKTDFSQHLLHQQWESTVVPSWADARGKHCTHSQTDVWMYKVNIDLIGRPKQWFIRGCFSRVSSEGHPMVSNLPTL